MYNIHILLCRYLIKYYSEIKNTFSKLYFILIIHMNIKSLEKNVRGINWLMESK